MTTPAVTDTVLSGLPAFTGLTIFLACAWIIPMLCRRVRLPDVVGLLVVGILLGPSCLNVFHPSRPVAVFLSDVGKLLLMFAAGLEVDLIQFRQTKGRSLCFGLLTFSLPLVTGTALGLCSGNGLNAAILIGSLLASHTLLAFPIVSKLGVVKNEAVTVTIGGTVFTDTGALLVLAICVSVHLIGFSPAAIGLQLLQLALYVPFILVGLGMTGRYLFAKFKISEEGQLLFLMLVVALSSSLAELIHLEGIVGAFLAGLARACDDGCGNRNADGGGDHGRAWRGRI
jgi:Kef-type K+ transport system membrane component KefB